MSGYLSLTVLVGAAGVGKSHVAARLASPPHPEEGYHQDHLGGHLEGHRHSRRRRRRRRLSPPVNHLVFHHACAVEDPPTLRASVWVARLAAWARAAGYDHHASPPSAGAGEVRRTLSCEGWSLGELRAASDAILQGLWRHVGLGVVTLVVDGLDEAAARSAGTGAEAVEAVEAVDAMEAVEAVEAVEAHSRTASLATGTTGSHPSTSNHTEATSDGHRHSEEPSVADLIGAIVTSPPLPHSSLSSPSSASSSHDASTCRRHDAAGSGGEPSRIPLQLQLVVSSRTEYSVAHLWGTTIEPTVVVCRQGERALRTFVADAMCTRVAARSHSSSAPDIVLRQLRAIQIVSACMRPARAAEMVETAETAACASSADINAPVAGAAARDDTVGMLPSALPSALAPIRCNTDTNTDTITALDMGLDRSIGAVCQSWRMVCPCTVDAVASSCGGNFRSAELLTDALADRHVALTGLAEATACARSGLLALYCHVREGTSEVGKEGERKSHGRGHTTMAFEEMGEENSAMGERRGGGTRDTGGDGDGDGSRFTRGENTVAAAAASPPRHSMAESHDPRAAPDAHWNVIDEVAPDMPAPPAGANVQPSVPPARPAHIIRAAVAVGAYSCDDTGGHRPDDDVLSMLQAAGVVCAHRSGGGDCGDGSSDSDRGSGRDSDSDGSGESDGEGEGVDSGGGSLGVRVGGWCGEGPTAPELDALVNDLAGMAHARRDGVDAASARGECGAVEDTAGNIGDGEFGEFGEFGAATGSMGRSATPATPLGGIRAGGSSSGSGVVLVLGATGAGKTLLLDRIMRRELMVSHDIPYRYLPAHDWLTKETEVAWDPNRAIVSQFGTPLEAKTWLGRIGLHAVPNWCKARGALSTGQGFRADLARRLQRAYYRFSMPRAEHSRRCLGGLDLSLPFFCDDFTSTLDRRTAACCVAALAKQLRSLGVAAVLCSTHADVASRLQPDFVVSLGKRNTVYQNSSAGQHTHVRIRLDAHMLLQHDAPPKPSSKTSRPVSEWATAEQGVGQGGGQEEARQQVSGQEALDQVGQAGHVLHPKRAGESEATGLGETKDVRGAESGSDSIGSPPPVLPGLPVVLSKNAAKKAARKAQKKVKRQRFRADLEEQTRLEEQGEAEKTHARLWHWTLEKCRRSSMLRMSAATYDGNYFDESLARSSAEPLGTVVCGGTNEKVTESMVIRSCVAGSGVGGSRGLGEGKEGKEGDDGHNGQAGLVLTSTVTLDDCTAMCDVLFDSAFHGRTVFVVPPLPETSGTGGESSESARPAGGVEGAGGIGVKSRDSTFRIGYIGGPSGSAKSVLLRYHFGEPTVVEWDHRFSVADHFAGDADFAQRFAAVGLNRRRHGQRRYNTLSTGEQHLADLARMLGHDSMLVDEFTSGLDPHTARTAARGIFDYIGKCGSTGAVFAGCRGDVIAPGSLDWVFDTETGTLYELPLQQPGSHRGAASNVLRSSDALFAGNATMVAIEVPQLTLKLRECGAGMWDLFRHHHYKSAALSTHTRRRSFVLLATPGGDDTAEVPVGFVATIPHNAKRNTRHDDGDEKSECNDHAVETVATGTPQHPRRAHRTVVLPEWQGFGIGSRLSDAAGELHRLEGRGYYGQTVHPSFGAYRDNSPLWAATRFNHTMQHFRIETWRQRLDDVRIRLRHPKFLFSHEYAGPRNDSERAYLSRRLEVVQLDA